MTPRKKIKLNFDWPKYEPEPEPPRRVCALCREERSGHFYAGDIDAAHQPVCDHCRIRRGPLSYERYGNDYKLSVAASRAEAVLRAIKEECRRGR